jgi:hypothetical protein
LDGGGELRAVINRLGQEIGQEVFGNRVVTDHGYTENTGRLGSMTSVLPGSPGSPATTVRSWSYDYFSDGNLRLRSDKRANQHEAFGYDQLARLKSWAAADSGANPLPGGWTVDYSIDDFGNLTRRNFVAGTTTGGSSDDLTYQHRPGTNQLESSFLGGYSYDAKGNQTGRPGGENVTYTAFDLPKEITGPRPATSAMLRWMSSSGFSVSTVTRG